VSKALECTSGLMAKYPFAIRPFPQGHSEERGAAD
jgi:hypothetical protein